MVKRDYYEILGVGRDADLAAIKKAYRKVALETHPDRNPGNPRAEEEFKAAAEAFDVLKDPQKRAIYDRHGHAGLDGSPVSHGFSDVGDIFEAFGDIFSGFGLGDIFWGGSRRSRAGGQRGEPIEAEVSVTLEDVFAGRDLNLPIERLETCESCRGEGAAPGSSRTKCRTCDGHGVVLMRQGFFSMRQTCPDCHGEGMRIEKACPDCQGRGRQPRKRTIEVKIPRGLPQNAHVRLRGEGHQGLGGGPPGDLDLVLHEKQHEIFEREGDDLLLALPISYPQAVLGAKIEVPTLEGSARLDIPPGTQPGKVFSIRGQGLPRYQRSGRGQMHVRIEIHVPKRISPAEEELLRKLAEHHREQVGKKAKGLFAKVKEIFE